MDDDYDFFKMARERDSWEVHRYMQRCAFPLVGNFVNHEGWNPNDWGEVISVHDGLAHERRVTICSINGIHDFSPHCINFPRLSEPPRNAERIFALVRGLPHVYQGAPWIKDKSAYTAWSLDRACKVMEL